jgi:ankyrin repeat protein
MQEHVATEDYLAVSDALFEGNEAAALKCLKENSSIFHNPSTCNLLMGDACRGGCASVLGMLLSNGGSVDYTDRKLSLLSRAVAKGHIDVVSLLLERKANPNLTRAFVTAVSGNEVGKHRLEIVELMIQHGVDVNKVYAMFGDKKQARTALDFTSPGTPVHELLLKNGAKTAAQVLAENPNVEIED